MPPPKTPPRHRAPRTTAIALTIITSAVLGGLAGWWLVSDPGPGDRQTFSTNVPLRA